MGDRFVGCVTCRRNVLEGTDNASSIGKTKKLLLLRDRLIVGIDDRWSATRDKLGSLCGKICTNNPHS